MRRSIAGLAVGAVAVLLLAGCGDDDKVGAKPDLPSETPPLWNPCDVLDARLIEQTFGSTTVEEHGTATEPECRFKPKEKSGEAVVTSSYTLFEGTLAEAWDTMGQPDTASVTEPDIKGADAARVVASVVKKQLYVTGFVENGDLIQNVNVVDPAPYDEAQVLAGVSTVLTALSQHADDKGLTK
ncbi:hypothetical protein F0U44_07575 [Nocardioides humilatus]|uniref:DUF3558 domain-containing protein n=1 Tax=Nocardioides humilatus TaxID=2607660 RepID=A0A5B1LJ89_9ACTN|nr:hypothetical protein [Nocardioides humilatus]KAA1420268.1 hypothetical protein F0U44_07575 [Nocardioides humilatus]